MRRFDGHDHDFEGDYNADGTLDGSVACSICGISPKSALDDVLTEADTSNPDLAAYIRRKLKQVGRPLPTNLPEGREKA